MEKSDCKSFSNNNNNDSASNGRNNRFKLQFQTNEWKPKVVCQQLSFLMWMFTVKLRVNYWYTWTQTHTHTYRYRRRNIWIHVSLCRGFDSACLYSAQSMRVKMKNIWYTSWTKTLSFYHRQKSYGKFFLSVFNSNEWKHCALLWFKIFFSVALNFDFCFVLL